MNSTLPESGDISQEAILLVPMVVIAGAGVPLAGQRAHMHSTWKNGVHQLDCIAKNKCGLNSAFG